MKKTIDEWMQSTLSKQRYDELLRDMPSLIGISKKTWQNYRLGITSPTVELFGKIQAVFAEHGYSLSLDEIITKEFRKNIEKEFFEQHGFFIRDSSYWIIVKNQEMEVSNFVMEFLSFTGQVWRVKLQRWDGETFFVEIKDSETSPAKLDFILRLKRCSFFGTPKYFRRVLSYSMECANSKKQAL